jgi:hypothetical protein
VLGKKVFEWIEEQLTKLKKVVKIDKLCMSYEGGEIAERVPSGKRQTVDMAKNLGWFHIM